MSDDRAGQSPGAAGSISTVTVIGNLSCDTTSNDIQSFLGGGIPSNAGQTGTGDLLPANQDDPWLELSRDPYNGLFDAFGGEYTQRLCLLRYKYHSK
jgi:hypothetical protein